MCMLGKSLTSLNSFVVIQLVLLGFFFGLLSEKFYAVTVFNFIHI